MKQNLPLFLSIVLSDVFQVVFTATRSADIKLKKKAKLTYESQLHIAGINKIRVITMLAFMIFETIIPDLDY